MISRVFWDRTFSNFLAHCDITENYNFFNRKKKIFLLFLFTLADSLLFLFFKADFDHFSVFSGSVFPGILVKLSSRIFLKKFKISVILQFKKNSRERRSISYFLLKSILEFCEKEKICILMIGQMTKR